MLVNLIPYNENGLGLPGASEDELFHAPRTEDVHAFQRALWEQGVLCTVRATKGEDERSACGQLATAATTGAKTAATTGAKTAATTGAKTGASPRSSSRVAVYERAAGLLSE